MKTAAEHADAILRAAGVNPDWRRDWERRRTAILAAVTAAMEDASEMTEQCNERQFEIIQSLRAQLAEVEAERDRMREALRLASHELQASAPFVGAQGAGDVYRAADACLSALKETDHDD